MLLARADPLLDPLGRDARFPTMLRAPGFSGAYAFRQRVRRKLALSVACALRQTMSASNGGGMASDERSAYIDRVAELVGLDIPAVCRPGVEANLALFLRHAAIVAAADDDPTREPAEVLRP